MSDGTQIHYLNTAKAIMIKEDIEYNKSDDTFGKYKREHDIYYLHDNLALARDIKSYLEKIDGYILTVGGVNKIIRMMKYEGLRLRGN